MKKIKSLFVALVASFGMLTTLAGGLGIYINDVEVGAGSTPKDCGWTHKKSADIMPCPVIPTWRENENVITFTKPGEYAISGSNSTDHVQIVIDADCTLVLENLYLIANKMHIAYSKDALAISEYTRVYPAVTVNPKRHATIALWGEKVRLRGSMTYGDIVVAPNASVVLDDWDGGTVKTDTISIFNQGTLTVESRCSSDIYCNNAGVLNHYGSGALWYDHRKYYWYVPKNAKYGKYIDTWAISQYEEFNERCGLEYVTPEVPDSTLYSVECTGGTLNKRSGGALYGYQKGVPIHTKSIYYGGGSFNVESIGDWKDGNMADCSMSATEEIVIAGGSIEVMRRIYAGKRILITGGNVMAGGCITAPEVRISGGEVSANGEWGKYQWIIHLDDHKYCIDTVASSHLPAATGDLSRSAGAR